MTTMKKPWPPLPADLIADLRERWVPRREITEALSIPTGMGGVKDILEDFAASAGLVPERAFTNTPNSSRYRLRPPKDGEVAGKLVLWDHTK